MLHESSISTIKCRPSGSAGRAALVWAKVVQTQMNMLAMTSAGLRGCKLVFLTEVLPCDSFVPNYLDTTRSASCILHDVSRATFASRWLSIPNSQKYVRHIHHPASGG